MTALAQLFVRPLPFPDWLFLWTFLPLALCIAVVYRATRARTPRRLLWPTLISFAQIVLGMVGLAIGFYVAHELAIRWNS